MNNNFILEREVNLNGVFLKLTKRINEEHLSVLKSLIFMDSETTKLSKNIEYLEVFVPSTVGLEVAYDIEDILIEGGKQLDNVMQANGIKILTFDDSPLMINADNTLLIDPKPLLRLNVDPLFDFTKNIFKVLELEASPLEKLLALFSLASFLDNDKYFEYNDNMDSRSTFLKTNLIKNIKSEIIVNDNNLRYPNLEKFLGNMKYDKLNDKEEKVKSLSLSSLTFYLTPLFSSLNFIIENSKIYSRATGIKDMKIFTSELGLLYQLDAMQKNPLLTFNDSQLESNKNYYRITDCSIDYQCYVFTETYVFQKEKLDFDYDAFGNFTYKEYITFFSDYYPGNWANKLLPWLLKVFTKNNHKDNDNTKNMELKNDEKIVRYGNEFWATLAYRLLSEKRLSELENHENKQILLSYLHKDNKDRNVVLYALFLELFGVDKFLDFINTYNTINQNDSTTNQVEIILKLFKAYDNSSYENIPGLIRYNLD